MTVYVVLCGDRHVDAEIFVFYDPVAAVAYAWQFARENARRPEYIEEEESPWLLYLRWNEEGDFVRVEATEVQP